MEVSKQVYSWAQLFLEPLFVSHLWLCVGLEERVLIAVVCWDGTGGGHRRSSPCHSKYTTEEMRRVWFYPGTVSSTALLV